VRLVLVGLAAAWFGWVVIGLLPKVDHGLRTLIGVLATCPLAVLALGRGPWPLERGGPRLAGAGVAAAMTLALLLVVLRVRGSGGGLELGSRYLLPILPFLVIGAVDAMRSSRRVLLPIGVALAVLSALATKANFGAMWKVRESGALLVDGVRRSGTQVVVTSFWWGPQVLAPLYEDHVIYGSPDDKLLAALVGAGTTSFTVALGGIEPHETPRFSVQQDEVLWPPKRVVRFRLLPKP
jgi:hypothetical protein